MMDKRHLLSTILTIASLLAGMAEGRMTWPLNGSGWYMQRDKQASWQDDQLYLPGTYSDVSELPVNPPTGGWQVLTADKGMAVLVPGTVEEYLTKSEHPSPNDQQGVSWWYRTLRIPATAQGRRFILHFESVRLRAEVYLDGQLVAYDMIGETPFDADITKAVRPGSDQLLAVRVTNPGGNFHWQDFDHMKWGNYNMLPSRAFSGIIGRVWLDAVSDTHISDIYMQNTPAVTKANAILTLASSLPAGQTVDVQVDVVEKGNGKTVFSGTQRKVAVKGDSTSVSIAIDAPQAKAWSPESPQLYTAVVRLKQGKRVVDEMRRDFGFRWFGVDGIGKDAVLRLNGKRMMLRTAIGWGYFPVKGLIVTPEMAVRQIKTARSLGYNMLNFHRSIGSPVAMEVADSLGFLYFEEPGGYHSAGRDPFSRAIANEKLQRMVRRDRSHPSLVIYNLINEFFGPYSRDKELIEKRLVDMRRAHELDPSRLMTLCSGNANRDHVAEVSKSHFRPFNDTLYQTGWYDNHRAGGPETWTEKWYKSPTDNFMRTNNRGEIWMRGEEGALSSPVRIQLIHDEIQRTGKTGWDGLFWERQYQQWNDYFQRKQLARDFGTLDSLTRSLSDVSYYHQGRRIEGMRMQNVGDIYATNGWEAMPYDNHSGVVDIYRNPKGNTQVLARYAQPLYVAVCPRRQVVKAGRSIPVDFYIVNEKNVSGSYRLHIVLTDDAGKQLTAVDRDVNVTGGETYGELLAENITMKTPQQAGILHVTARLESIGGQAIAEGSDDVMTVSWSADDLQGTGAYYGLANNPVARFYNYATDRELPALDEKTGRLDWLVVDRSAFEEPEVVTPEFFKRPVKVTWFNDDDMRSQVAVTQVKDINRSFADGAQPDPSIQANQSFTAIWEGEVTPTESGTIMFGVKTDRGVRLKVNGAQLVDKWSNGRELQESRPIEVQAGVPVKVRVEYRQTKATGQVQLVWSRPSAIKLSPEKIFDRAKNDGTTVILLNNTDSWMQALADYAGLQYKGNFSVGKNWVGGIHFARRHPLLDGLPQATALNWPYQQVVRNGDNRQAFRIDGEEQVVGAWRSWPFELGTAVGVVPCGKGRIIFSTLDIVSNLRDQSGPAEVARKLLCNFIKTYQ